MKSLILTIICAFCLVLLHGQSITINPKIAFGTYGISQNSPEIVNAKLLWSLGSDVRIGGGTIFLNTGLHYENNTLDFVQTANIEEGNLHYLRLPANLGIYLTGRDGLLIIHAKGGLSNYFNIGKSNITEPYSENIKSFYAAGNIGLGFEVLKYIHIGFDYEFGLTEYIDLPSQSNNKRAFYTSLGLTF